MEALLIVTSVVAFFYFSVRRKKDDKLEAQQKGIDLDPKRTGLVVNQSYQIIMLRRLIATLIAVIILILLVVYC